MTNHATAEALIQELAEANQLYSMGEGESPLSDEDFDAKRNLLETWSELPELQDLFLEGTPGWALLEHTVSLGATLEKTADTVTHAHPMLSLAKAKNEQELTAWIKRMRAAGVEDFRCQVKLDGFALSAIYQDGKLIQLATRGTGTVGENTTYVLSDKNVTIVGLPKRLPEAGLLELRGELFFTQEQFEAADAQRYAHTTTHFKNSRNAVVGLMKKAKLGVDYPVEFTYSTYSALLNGEPLDLSEVSGDILSVDRLTREQSPTTKLTGFTDDADLQATIKQLGEDRKSWTIPTDGVVIKPLNEAEMLKQLGATSHHPVSQVAYKYPGATGQTVVLAITTTVGKTGKLTPCATVAPVLVNGIELSNATMSNFNWMYTKGVKVGSVVEVHRANDVIPEIKTVLSSPEEAVFYPVPTECPECGGPLVKGDGDYDPPRTLRCTNEECPSRGYFALKAVVSKNYLDIDGMAEGALSRLYEEGLVTDWADLYKLTQDFLQERPMGVSKEKGTPIKVGAKRAANIMEHIEASKYLPLQRLLVSLTIQQLGPSTAKVLVKAYPTLAALQAASVEELAALLGPTNGPTIHQGLKLREDLINRLLAAGVELNPTPKAPTPTEEAPKPLAGKAFTISGDVPAGFSNRKELEEWVEASGGTWHSAPKAETDFIIGDPSETSAKVKKAHALQAKGSPIQFLSPTEFTHRFPKK